MQLFLETKTPPKTEVILAGSIVQHWQARHLYSKALVVCDSPEPFLKLAKKRWMNAMQQMQHERTQTVDAEKLLQLTHAITRMQQVTMVAQPPHEQPSAHFWCITPAQLEHTELPRACRSLYTNSPLDTKMRAHIYDILPTYSLVVDFTQSPDWQLPSKKILEDKVHAAWQELSAFFATYEIDTRRLVLEQGTIDALDDALDTLLDVSNSFLRHARQFQEALHLAQPLALDHATMQQYEIANTLARQVSMLSPSMLHHSFIQNSNENFMLYDVPAPNISRESLTVAIARHVSAGRKNLARALESAFVNNTLSVW